ncbi:hypothetical protein B0O99DRAFT_396533 [Bisporella sp. PMI_857]|nr:hypothetical protein B0O99DRAFT_396533 [Bisporella sp. PMI_857]
MAITFAVVVFGYETLFVHQAKRGYWLNTACVMKTMVHTLSAILSPSVLALGWRQNSIHAIMDSNNLLTTEPINAPASSELMENHAALTKVLSQGVDFERILAEQPWPQQNNHELQLQLVPSANTFTCFPKLPPELRQVIWSFACKGEPLGGPRIHRIAPDPVNCSRSVWESARVQFSIIHQHPYPVPSLLHACRDSRNAAIEVHALWPCANPDTCAKYKRSIYVNKAYDIFFFGDMACGRSPRVLVSAYNCQ